VIGYIGLGNIGGALARRLALSQPVIGFDLSAQTRESHARGGMQIGSDASALAGSCDLIFLCLPTSRHEGLLVGEGGIAGVLKTGAIVVDQTSGDPAATRALAERLAKRDVTLIDAPVSGGPQGAQAGTIAIMVGSGEASFAKVRPVLESISPNVFHVGPVGTGNVAKLANNLLSGGIRLMTLEAVALAAKNGLSKEMAVKVFGASGGNSFWLQKYGESLFVKGELGSSFKLGLIHKDVRLACDMGTNCGMPMFFGNQVRAFYEMAINEYDPAAAVNNIAHVMERIAKVELVPTKK
jgi:3-hydroxyisobutyrate dehydrogenase